MYTRDRNATHHRDWPKWGLLAALMALWSSGCTTARSSGAVSDAEPIPSASCVAPGTWVLPGRGTVTMPALMDKIEGRRVVLLGEYHDDVMHHTWQLGVISGLAARHGNVVIGLEMLPRSAQPALDRWIKGEISEKEFARQSQWWEYWKFDPALYMPILRFAQLHQIPVYGLNVERSLVDAVRAKGWENVPQAERGGLTDPALPSADYLETLALSYSMHGAHGGGEHGATPDMQRVINDPGFKRFVQGQQLWDRGIAHAIDDLAARHPDATIIGLMGSGHLMDRAGVPHQLADLGIAESSVLLPWDEAFDCALLTPAFADAVFGVPSTASITSEEGPKLGVQIEPTHQGVRVAKVVAGSVAEGAGMHDDDVLLTLGGRNVRNVEDVVTTVRAMLPGAWLPVTVQRGGERLDLVAKFPLLSEDSAPAARSP